MNNRFDLLWILQIEAWEKFKRVCMLFCGLDVRGKFKALSFKIKGCGKNKGKNADGSECLTADQRSETLIQNGERLLSLEP